MSERCAVCGREADEVARSDQLGAECCETCYSRGTSPTDAPDPPVVRAPRYEPGAYERLVRRVWAGLEAAGTVFYVTSDYIAGRCPVCSMGTVNVHFIPTDPPEIEIDGCTAGCSVEQLAKAL